MSNEIGLGIAVAGVALGISYCAVADKQTQAERFKVCAEHGGKATKWSDCRLPEGVSRGK